MLIRVLLCVLSVALLTAGVWFIYWPAALIVAAVPVGVLGLYWDDRKKPIS